jgi:type I restriction enzyme, R subunit
VRAIIDSREHTDRATNPVLSIRDFRAVPANYRTLAPEYVKDYTSLNQYTA